MGSVMETKSKTLGDLIGGMRARRIVKKYFYPEYVNDIDKAVESTAAIPMVNSLSDTELLSINGVGRMCVQRIRKACEEKPTAGSSYVVLNVDDLRAGMCPFLEQDVTKHNLPLFIAWVEDLAKAEWVQMLINGGKVFYILRKR
jgi:hypothetical protein